MDHRAENIKKFLVKHIPHHPRDIVSFAANHFSVTRTTIHRHLNYLVKNNKIFKTGTTRKMHYTLASNLDKSFQFSNLSQLDEFDILQQYLRNDFLKLNERVKNKCEYGFTEIFNNAIEHSNGKRIIVQTQWKKNEVQITITDDGVGIFRKLQEGFDLDDTREAILQLSKGKMTTAPKDHTGEGIFFSSRVFDRFDIYSYHLHYHRDNIEDDWYLEKFDDVKVKGTEIVLTAFFDSKIDLIEVFKEFQNPESYAFDRTHIVVELSKFNEETFISRSQAKRILRELDKFTYVTLDFRNIIFVGQGFVDEIFRVYKRLHPRVQIKYINARDDVSFMIERGIASAKTNKS